MDKAMEIAVLKNAQVIMGKYAQRLAWGDEITQAFTVVADLIDELETYPTAWISKKGEIF